MTVEGNAANAVRARTRYLPDNVAFVQVPGIHNIPAPTKVVTRWRPRFEVATSENGHAKVLVRGKWATVGVKLPGLLAKYHAARLRRYMVKVETRVPV